MRRKKKLCAFLLCIAWANLSSFATPPAFQVSAHTHHLSSGGVLWVEVSSQQPDRSIESAEGQFLGKTYRFFQTQVGNPTHWAALIGVPVDGVPQNTEFKIQVISKGTSEELIFPIQILGMKPVPASKVEKIVLHPLKKPSPRNVLLRVQRETDEMAKIFGKLTYDKLWDGPFQLPVQSAISSPFGGARTLNGHQTNSHQGTDFRAKRGQPIHAPGGGVVVFEKSLQVPGNTLILSHGFGLFTVYCHLSHFQTTVGQSVRTGDVIALAGATGRATGPHLHWGTILYQTPVDPMQVIRELR